MLLEELSFRAGSPERKILDGVSARNLSPLERQSAYFFVFIAQDCRIRSQIPLQQVVKVVSAQLVWLVLVTADLVLLQLHRLEERFRHSFVCDSICYGRVLIQLLTFLG